MDELTTQAQVDGLCGIQSWRPGGWGDLPLSLGHGDFILPYPQPLSASLLSCGPSLYKVHT